MHSGGLLARLDYSTSETARSEPLNAVPVLLGNQ